MSRSSRSSETSVAHPPMVDAAFNHSLPRREQWWRDFLTKYERTIRGYLRAAHLEGADEDEAYWDVIALAEEYEEALHRDDTWPAVRAIVRQACAERSRFTRRHTPVDANFLEQHSIQSDTDSEDDVVEREALLARAESLLRELPRQQRLGITLRYSVGLDYRLVAAGLGVNENTARVHVSRGLQALRKRFRGGHGAADSGETASPSGRRHDCVDRPSNIGRHQRFPDEPSDSHMPASPL